MFCRNCGKEIPDNAKFCKYCGNPVHHNNGAPTPSPQKPKKSHLVLILVIILIVLAAAVAALGVTWYMKIGPFAEKDDEIVYENNGSDEDDDDKDDNSSSSSSTASSSSSKAESDDRTARKDDISDRGDSRGSEVRRNNDDEDEDDDDFDDTDSSVPYVVDHRLSEDEISEMSNDELQLQINTLYAYHGYHFNKNKEAQAYFEGTDWYEDEGYTGTDDQQMIKENMMSDIEKDNLENMTKERASRQ